MNPETETHDVESVITPAVAELIALGACVAAIIRSGILPVVRTAMK